MGCSDSQHAVNYDEAFVISQLERQPDRGPLKCTCEEIKKCLPRSDFSVWFWGINPGSCTSGKHELTSLTKHLQAVILKRLGCVDHVRIFAAPEHVYHDWFCTADAVRTKQSTCWQWKLQESIHALRSFLWKRSQSLTNMEIHAFAPSSETSEEMQQMGMLSK